ncbi:MAG: NAD(P)/FAD-dependent oxidoreductase [Fimbriimonadaceae bacterium]|nr:NAD(P)/FAD-dependent oxidoreductase [Fimbriimonadaceae bacterium]
MGTVLAKKVVILGAGFGGMKCAQALARADVRVTVIDKTNHHLFQPLLYQVATAGLSAANIAWPVRSILRRQANASVLMAEVLSVDTDAKVVHHSEGETPYDVLVVATGSRNAYFGHDDWAAHTLGLKDVDDALALRNSVLRSFEEAEAKPDGDARLPYLTFVIIGGGPTGVEMAGSLAELAKRAMAGDFRRIDTTRARVVLVEGGDRVLPTFPPDLSAKAEQSLRHLGVEVRLGKRVVAIGDGYVCLPDDQIFSRNIVWAAGMAATPAAVWLGVSPGRGGRVVVDDHLRVVGLDGVYAIGDVAEVRDGDLPGVAQVAMQGGRHVAGEIVHGAGKPFVYRDMGTMATIGRKAAVAVIGGAKLSGAVAWAAWLTLHLAMLAVFRDRLIVFLQWVAAYFTFQPAARLITSVRSRRAADRTR